MRVSSESERLHIDCCSGGSALSAISCVARPTLFSFRKQTAWQWGAPMPNGLENTGFVDISVKYLI
jgi:hypothetical protein